MAVTLKGAGMGLRGTTAGHGWVELIGVFAAGVLLAWLASATPQPLSSAAPPDRFSAGRAMRDIGQLAQVAHPVGSVEDDHVRTLLVGKLRALQLAPQVRCSDDVAGGARRPPRTYRVCDVLAHVSGADARLPALLVMSHYDSVPRSPGAADDMAGVASALEMARLLRLHSPRREVVFAFTDGEEVGLLGARALLADQSFTRGVGAVFNMDVRGGGGRALMFETGRRAGGLQRLYAAHGLSPAGDSLAAYLYSVLPNDTDFTVALAHGMTGLNYAFIGRPALYHTPAATSQAVEAGAVQSLGAQVWALVQPLADSSALPAPEDDLTWFDLLGRWVVIYPPAVGWLPLAASAVLLLAAFARKAPSERPRVSELATGSAQVLGATILAAGTLYAYGRLALHDYYAALAQAPLTEALIAAACIGAALLLFRAAPPTRQPKDRWAGAIVVAWLIAAVLQAVAPRTAFVAEWPTLLATLALFSTTLGEQIAQLASLACAVLALGFLLEIQHMLVLGVGLTLPPIGAAIMPLALAVLAPLLQRTEREAEFPLRNR